MTSFRMNVCPMYVWIRVYPSSLSKSYLILFIVKRLLLWYTLMRDIWLALDYYCVLHTPSIQCLHKCSSKKHINLYKNDMVQWMFIFGGYKLSYPLLCITHFTNKKMYHMQSVFMFEVWKLPFLFGICTSWTSDELQKKAIWNVYSCLTLTFSVNENWKEKRLLPLSRRNPRNKVFPIAHCIRNKTVYVKIKVAQNLSKSTIKRLHLGCVSLKSSACAASLYRCSMFHFYEQYS